VRGGGTVYSALTRTETTMRLRTGMTELTLMGLQGLAEEKISAGSTFAFV
jgi:hypothetical protein